MQFSRYTKIYILNVFLFTIRKFLLKNYFVYLGKMLYFLFKLKKILSSLYNSANNNVMYVNFYGFRVNFFSTMKHVHFLNVTREEKLNMALSRLAFDVCPPVQWLKLIFFTPPGVLKSFSKEDTKLP